MGTISSSTGLISGLDIDSLVQGLMAIERRPVTLLERQIATLDAERTAMMTVSAKLMALKLAAVTLKSGVSFRPNSVTSSDESILTATVSAAAAAGTYAFRVRQTAQAHQLISAGFNDPAGSMVGTGTIALEIGQGRLDRDMELNFLNGHQGVRRGTIQITDRSGASAQVDLSATVTVGDVLDAINAAAGINVTAATQGDRIAITDNTGLTGTGVPALIVEDLPGGYTAADLGIVGSVSGNDNVLVGSDVIQMTDDTPLAMLNDGRGVRTTRDSQDDLSITLRDGTNVIFDLGDMLAPETSLAMLNHGQGVRLGSIRVTDAAGTETIVDLSSAQTVDDVMSTIKTATSDTIAVTLVGSHMLITDGSGGTGTLKIEDDTGSYTATDLGIAKEADSGKTSITGDDIFFAASTLQDVTRIIEQATGGGLTAQIASDGKRLELTDNTGGAGSLEITSLNGSGAAEDLGIAGTYTTSSVTGQRLVGGLNAVLLRGLNGGSGVTLGTITIQDRSGGTAALDLSAAETVDDVLTAINSAGSINVAAALNTAGTGIVVTDLTGSAANDFQISGTMADALGIAVSGAVTSVDSGNNQLQYVTENTLLADLRGGEGVSIGSFKITDSQGAQAEFSVGDADTMTIGDLMEMINNSAAINVQATINTTGDGILLTDQAGGLNQLTVADLNSGTTAKDLRLAGAAQEGGPNTLDGSFEYRIDVTAGQSLQDIVDALNDLDAPIEASVINDGSSVNAYRLSLSSTHTGRAGEIVFNAGDTDLGVFDLVEAQDAVVAFGGAGAGSTIVASSDTNTFSDMLAGVTLDVHQASDTPVTVTVEQDVDAVVNSVKDLVTKFNEMIDQIDEYTDYDPETEQAGVLIGSLTLDVVKSRLYSLFRSELEGVGSFTRAYQLGIRIGTGAKLEFDEEDFRAAYADDRQAVEDFFATFDQDAYTAASAEGDKQVDQFYADTQMGFAHMMDRIIDLLTRKDGTLDRVNDNYDDRRDLLSDRIDYLSELLTAKEKRLYREFYQMETALSKLQGMQSALLSYSPIEPISTSSSGTMF